MAASMLQSELHLRDCTIAPSLPALEPALARTLARVTDNMNRTPISRCPGCGAPHLTR